MTTSRQRRTESWPILATLPAAVIFAVGLVPSTALAQPQEPTVLRVDGDQGSPYKFLQDAIAFAETFADENNRYQLWVAATDPSNPYRPDQGGGHSPGDVGASFELHEFIDLRGGFLGTDHSDLPDGETDLAERDVLDNETVLSGSLTEPPIINECMTAQGDCFEPHDPAPGCADPVCCTLVCAIDPLCCDGLIGWEQNCVDTALDVCGGARHVVHGSDVNRDARLDGFTITGGSAIGTGDDALGGGIFVETQGINGIRDPLILNCRVVGNSATDGGGLYSRDQAGTGSFPIVRNCEFLDNEAANDGGGAWSGTQSRIEWVNCLFAGNRAANNGGGIYSDQGTNQNLTNVTLADNVADSDGIGGGLGGGLYLAEDNGDTVLTRIDNCIFWENTDSTGGGSDAQIHVVPDGATFDVTVSFSDVQGITPGGAPPNVNNGGGNIGADPVFFDQPVGNYRLSKSSPCIDAASNVSMPADEHDVDDDDDTLEPNPDRDLNARVIDDQFVPNTGMPDLDMGAYEFCRYDVNGDGDVGTADLLDLLMAWGANPGHPADFDEDGEVGTEDLLALLANWGGCAPSEQVSVPQSVEDCTNKFGYEDPLVLEHCICAVDPEECS